MLLLFRCAKESNADRQTEAELKKSVSFDGTQETKAVAAQREKPAEDATAEKRAKDACIKEANDDVFEDSKTEKDAGIVASDAITAAEETESEEKSKDVPTAGDGKKEPQVSILAKPADEHPKVSDAGLEETGAVPAKEEAVPAKEEAVRRKEEAVPAKEQDVPRKDQEVKMISADEIIAAERETESFKAEAASLETSGETEAVREPEQVEKEQSEAETPEAVKVSEKATASKAEEPKEAKEKAGQEAITEDRRKESSAEAVGKAELPSEGLAESEVTAETVAETLEISETVAETKATPETVAETKSASDTIAETRATSEETRVQAIEATRDSHDKTDDTLPAETVEEMADTKVQAAEATTDPPDRTDDSLPTETEITAEAVKASKGSAAAGDVTEPEQAVTEAD